MKNASVIEKTGNGCSAYIPDLPGYVAAGDTGAETEELMHKVIAYIWHPDQSSIKTEIGL